jgi:hypothetical protein
MSDVDYWIACDTLECDARPGDVMMKGGVLKTLIASELFVLGK